MYLFNFFICLFFVGFFFFFHFFKETRSCYIAQADPEILGSSDPPDSATPIGTCLGAQQYYF
jgi:hypothetical protein